MTTSALTLNPARRSKLLALLIAAALLFAACSESAADMSDGELREALIETLTEDGSVTTADATCITDGLFESVERDQLNRMADAQTADELTEEDLDVLFDVMLGCV